MNLSEEFEQILKESEDKVFVKNNAEKLRIFFSKTENLNILKKS